MCVLPGLRLAIALTAMALLGFGWRSAARADAREDVLREVTPIVMMYVNENCDHFANQSYRKVMST